METTSIKPHNNFNFPLNPSHTKNLLIVAAVAANGIYNNHYHNIEDTTAKLSDIEMVSLQAAAYTSLKDLLPTSPTLVLSPTTTSRKDSWREIPIKDPLVQHAAWAYLQPMAAAQQSDNRNLVEKLKERFCGLFGCFNDVFLAIKKGWCSENEAKSEINDGEGEDDKVD